MEDSEDRSTPDLLTLSCEDDGLSEAQLESNRKHDEAYKKVIGLLDSLNQTHKVVGTGKPVYGLVPKEASPVSLFSAPAPHPAPSLPPTVTTASKQVLLSVPVIPDVTRIAQEYNQNPATMPGPPPLVLRNSTVAAKSVAPTPSTYKLVMDRRLGLIVGTVPAPQGIPATPITQGTTTVAKPNLAPGNIPASIVMQTPAIVVNADQGLKTQAIHRVVRPPGNTIRVLHTTPGSQIPFMGSGTPTIRVLQDSSLSNRLPCTQVVSSQYTAPRAAVPQVVGSLPANSLPVSNQQSSISEGNSSSEENRSLTGDSSQKVNARLYPSLMVTVKPTLQSKEYTTSVCSKMRAELDKELKKVLQLPPNELTEWLIQQGLIRAEQKCHTHLDSNYQPIPFQLGIYSDSSKFPNSGGYVWVSECCGQRHLSVFAGSIFEGVPHTPKTILKLIYHWACQTSSSNIAQWVHVTMNYIKIFHTAMRAVCVASVHEKLRGLGGDRKEVEVAIMTLGTSSNDGKLKQVKVEILGVLDQEKNIVRLFAAEPPQKILGAAPPKRNYREILRPLADWVDKKSIIVTDLSIDQKYLLELGFSLVKQSTARSDNVLRIVEYLSSSIPRSFQNVLPLINRTLIQQYLDEISWREAFGPSPLQAFKNFVTHLAEVTKLELGQTLMACLNQISCDPFQNWSYCNLCKQNSEAIVLPNSPGVPTPIIPTPVAPIPGIDNILRVMVNEPSSSPEYKIDCLPESIKQVDPVPKKIRKRNLDIEESPQPSASPVIAKKPRTQTVLQEYYYGRIKGKSKEDLDREEAQWRANPANSSVVEFQCCVCQRMFTNNLLFMRHLMKHTQNKGNVDLSDETPVCKYCLRTFQSSPMLERHVKEDHIVKKGQLTCRICNIIFFSTLKLTEHMHNTHVELELPYSCKICGYRSSMHRDVVDHFHEFHDGSRKLQCPFCLQVVTLSGRGKHSVHNVFLFFQHIQKHFVQPRSIKCDKCILRFVTKANIQEHVARDHLSCKGKPGLTRLQFKGESIIMPVPESLSQPSSSPMLATKTLPAEPLSSVSLPRILSGVNGKVKYRNKTSMLNHAAISPIMGMPQEEVKIKRVDFAVSPKCCECKGNIYQERHFLTNLVCSHCRYITCCSNAIKAHVAEFHVKEEDSGLWRLSSGIKPKLLCRIRSKLLIPMYCICGFSSNSGDALAKHLAQSDCRTAYSSLEDTKALENQSASFPPLVILDDEDQSNNLIKAYAERMAHPLVSSPSPGNSLPAKSIGEPQSMLNILGLVRKPSTDESSNDIPDVDEKGELTMDAVKTSKSSKTKRKRRR